MLRFNIRIFLVICCLLSNTYGFHISSILQSMGPLVYGRQLRAELPINTTISDGESEHIEAPVVEDGLSWWHSLSRNNTINCKCGEFTQTQNYTKQWESEGIETLNEYPWSVSLVSPGSNLAYCGGSLVNDRFVLTSATCVEGAKGGDIEVLVGSWPKAHFIPNPSGDEDDAYNFQLNTESVFRKRVQRVILNPKYVTNVLDFNIALLRLDGPVPTFGFAGGVSPVCLPEAGASYDGLESTNLLWRFHQEDGFIVPEKRTEVNSTILSKETCRGLAYNEEWEIMPDTMLCSQMDEQASSALVNAYGPEAWDCPGDAGGPLLVTVNDQKVQVGIDSWTACYGRPKGVGVFTRVQDFLDWIKLHISEDGRICAY